MIIVTVIMLIIIKTDGGVKYLNFLFKIKYMNFFNSHKY